MTTFYLELYRKQIPLFLATLPGANRFDSTKPNAYWAVLVTTQALSNANPTSAEAIARTFLAPGSISNGAFTHGTDTVPEDTDDYRPNSIGIWRPARPPYKFTVTSPGGQVFPLLDPPNGGGGESIDDRPITLTQSGLGIWTVDVELSNATRFPVQVGTGNGAMNPDLLPTTLDEFLRQPLLIIEGPEVSKLDCPEPNQLVANGCAPGDVTFQATLAGDETAIVEVMWDFGDGNTETLSQGQIPPFPVTKTHHYDAVPARPAKLRIRRRHICEEKYSRMSVTVPACFTCPTVVDVRVSQGDCDADGTHRVMNLRAVTAGGTPSQFVWKFGDGTPDENVPGTALDAGSKSHPYLAPGSYTGRLTVNSPGCPDSFKDFYVGVAECVACPSDFNLAVKQNNVLVNTANGVAPGVYHIEIMAPAGSPLPSGSAISWWDNTLQLVGGQEVIDPAIPTTDLMHQDQLAIDYNFPAGDRRHRITAKVGVNDYCAPTGSVTLKPADIVTGGGDQPTVVATCPELSVSVKGCVPGDVTFVVSGSNLTLVERYDWVFGDGQTMVTGTLGEGTIIVPHTYYERRPFDASVKITGPAGCASKTQNMTVPACATEGGGNGGGGGGLPQIPWCLLLGIVALAMSIGGAAWFAVFFCVLCWADWIIIVLAWAGLITAGTTTVVSIVLVIVLIILIFIGLAIMTLGNILFLIWLFFCGSCRTNCNLLNNVHWFLVLILIPFWAIITVIAAICGFAGGGWRPCALGWLFGILNFGILDALLLYYGAAVGCFNWADFVHPILRLRIPDPLRVICGDK